MKADMPQPQTPALPTMGELPESLQPVARVVRDDMEPEFKIDWLRVPGANGTLLYRGDHVAAAIAQDRAARAVPEGAIAALTELVALKDLKDAIECWVRDDATGKQWPKMPMAERESSSDDYARRKPLAWAAARAVLAAAPPAGALTVLQPSVAVPAVVDAEAHQALLKAAHNATQHFYEFNETPEALAASEFGRSMDALEEAVGRVRDNALKAPCRAVRAAK